MTATTPRVLLGMLTPSSNTVLEPVTAALLSGIAEASAHFGRFRVTEIALSQSALAQFDDTEILAAARLLSHARCQVIAWNGTAAGWRGFHMDEALCAAITRETGAMAATSVLALNEILALTGVKRLGIVSPYTDDVQAAIARNYESVGIAVTGEVHEGLSDNYSFSEITADRMRAMAREVARARPEAIAIYCTNMRGAPLAESLEAELGIPVYDTVSTVLWKSLKLTGVDTRRIQGWGSLFREV